MANTILIPCPDSPLWSPSNLIAAAEAEPAESAEAIRLEAAVNAELARREHLATSTSHLTPEQAAQLGYDKD
jgi:hypothetical protein